MIWAVLLQLWSYSWGASGPSWQQYGADLRKTSASSAPRAYVMRLNGAQAADLPYISDNPRSVGWADSLVSPCLDTRFYDTVYIRFAYQRGGYCEPPEPDDTLRLWGLDQDGVWRVVWQATGSGQADTSFATVTLALSDTVWRHACFRLRWSAWGSLYGAYDNWLLAYTAVGPDSTASEPHFVRIPRTYWRPYSVGPASQANQADSLFTLVSGPAGLTVKLLRVVNASAVSQLLACTGGIDTVWWPPLPNLGETRYDVVWQIERLSGEVIESWLDTTALGPYYGYDDDEMERGYGLVIADRPFFQVFDLDTMVTADKVAIRFFPVPTQVGKSFQLGIWDLEAGGAPVYLRFHRIRLDSITGGFVDYALDTVLRLTGRVGVGFIQADNAPLGIGWDGSYEGATVVFRDSAGQWVPSRQRGCLLVRLGLGAGNAALAWGPQPRNWYLQPIPVSRGGRVRVVGRAAGSLRVIDGMGRQIASWEASEVVAPDQPGLYWVVDQIGGGQLLWVLP